VVEPLTARELEDGLEIYAIADFWRRRKTRSVCTIPNCVQGDIAVCSMDVRSGNRVEHASGYKWVKDSTIWSSDGQQGPRAVIEL
jgi:hypothetical protein